MFINIFNAVSVDKIRLKIHFWNVIHLHPACFSIESDKPGDVSKLKVVWTLLQVPPSHRRHDHDLPAGVQQSTGPVLQLPLVMPHLNSDYLTMLRHRCHLHLPLHECSHSGRICCVCPAMSLVSVVNVDVGVHIPDQSEVPRLHALISRSPHQVVKVRWKIGVRPIIVERCISLRMTIFDVDMTFEEDCD